MNLSFIVKPAGDNLVVEFNYNGDRHSFIMPKEDRGSLIMQLNDVIKNLEDLSE